MRTRLVAAASAAFIALVLALPASGAGGVQLTPVGRLPFPQKAYVIDLAKSVPVASLRVHIRENGAPIAGVDVGPITGSGLTFASVLVIDGSESMYGAPYAAALDAAASFVDKRGEKQQVGLVSFNSRSVVLQAPTRDAALLHRALSRPPGLDKGTHIYDALMRSLALLDRAQVSAGSIVLLSDGADTGSRSALDAVVARALRQHVRVFTVGLESEAFDPGALGELADRTHGTYAEAGSASQLTSIFSSLSGKLANEFVVRYRSRAAVGSHVHVAVAVERQGIATATYVAPKPSGFAPFHRSLLSRFLLSTFSLVFCSLVGAILVAFGLLSVFRRPRVVSIVDRVGRFSGATDARSMQPADDETEWAARGDGATGLVPKRLRARVAEDFELARITLSPDMFVIATAVATVVAIVALAAVSWPFALLAVLVPIFARAWVSAKIKRVRDDFGEQLPDTLQLLASALRTGHSFLGGLNVIMKKAAEPMRRELARVLTDDQIGLPVEDSLRHIARRMANRDMEQLALLGELQRTAGGNSAEVLDTVVSTVRERTDVRRLARTLTAQGRMARWILTLLPVVMAAYLSLMQPALMRPLFTSGLGQTALVISALMVVAGSFWVKQITEIKV